MRSFVCYKSSIGDLMGVLELISDQICPGTINSKLVDALDIKL